MVALGRIMEVFERMWGRPSRIINIKNATNSQADITIREKAKVIDRPKDILDPEMDVVLELWRY